MTLPLGNTKPLTYTTRKVSMNGSADSKDSTSAKKGSGTTATEETAKNSTSGSVRHLKWVTKPDDAVVYDDAFWVKKQRWGTFVSVGADDLEIITALYEEICVDATRGYLKMKQEGFTDDAPTYDSFVGGKL